MHDPTTSAGSSGVGDRHRQGLGEFLSAASWPLLSAVFHYLAFLLIRVPFPCRWPSGRCALPGFVPVVGTYTRRRPPAGHRPHRPAGEALWIITSPSWCTSRSRTCTALACIGPPLDVFSGCVRCGDRKRLAPSIPLGPVGALLALPQAPPSRPSSPVREPPDVVRTHLTKPPWENDRSWRCRPRCAPPPERPPRAGQGFPPDSPGSFIAFFVVFRLTAPTVTTLMRSKGPGTRVAGARRLPPSSTQRRPASTHRPQRRAPRHHLPPAPGPPPPLVSAGGGAQLVVLMSPAPDPADPTPAGRGDALPCAHYPCSTL